MLFRGPCRGVPPFVDTLIAGSSVPWRGCLHVRKAEAEKEELLACVSAGVIDTGRPIALVAREIGVGEALLGR